MSQTMARALLALAAFLLAALLMGAFAGPARGLVLCTVGLLCLAVCRMKLPAADGVDALAPGSRSWWRRNLDRWTWGARDESAGGAELAPGALYGVCVLDEQHRVLWCNGTAARHFAIAPRAATGLPVARLVFAQEFDAWLAAGDFSRALRLETLRGGGTTLSISLVLHLHSQWLLLSRDVTAESRVEMLRRDGVADALHELCTPVTVLAGHLDTLRRLRLDPWRSFDYLDYMEQQCRRMQATIGDLVKLWTLDSAPPPPVEERVDVSSMLAGIRLDMEALSGGRHHIALDAEAGVGLYGSEREIASAFRNLALNAIRYTPPGGAVWMVWRQIPSGAEMTVEDNGIGIAREHIPRLTERFFRVDRDYSRAQGGSGLGLSIVQNVLARHGAKLEIDSEPGRGSRFSARFPIGRVLTMTEALPAEIATAAEAVPEAALPAAPDAAIPASAPQAVMRIPEISRKIPAPL